MLLYSCAERVWHFIERKDNERDFLRSIDLPVERANSELRPCHNAVDGNFDDDPSTALDVGHHGGV